MWPTLWNELGFHRFAPIFEATSLDSDSLQEPSEWDFRLPEIRDLVASGTFHFSPAGVPSILPNLDLEHGSIKLRTAICQRGRPKSVVMKAIRR